MSKLEEIIKKPQNKEEQCKRRMIRDKARKQAINKKNQIKKQ